jgi:ATP-dependent Lon protease
VILPRENEKDLAEIPSEVAGELTVVLVGHMDEVLPAALERPPVALPVVEETGEDGDRAH